MPKRYSLDEIKFEVDRLAAQVGAPDTLLPTYGYSVDGAHPHIEVDSRGYHYVVVERGEEIDRLTTGELDELLYNIFKHVTFELAGRYELNHRIAHQDFRRLLFQRQIELLAMLSPNWSEMESQEHERILQDHPYDDRANIRANLSRALSEQGLSPEAAWKKACEKYPLPEKRRESTR